jgi:hypothetical protein
MVSAGALLRCRFLECVRDEGLDVQESQVLTLIAGEEWVVLLEELPVSLP